MNVLMGIGITIILLILMFALIKIGGAGAVCEIIEAIIEAIFD